MSQLIISVSGLRGVVGESLTPEITQKYVAAFLRNVPASPIVVTRDGRANGPPFVEAIKKVLSVWGRPCLDGGVAATPTTGILVRSYGAGGGIQVSASHNPSEYNGIKLFDQKGRVVSAQVGRNVLDCYQTSTCDPLELHDKLYLRSQTGSHELSDTTSRHIELLSKICNIDRIRRRRFRILLDANHGAGSVLGRRLLNELGCEVNVLGEKPDGLFSHPPEPTSENLQTVLAKVRETKADIGFCQDPDADRLAIIDENGKYIGEEFTLALVADHVLRQTPGPVVTNCSTSRMTQDIAEKYGVPFFRSKVGEANVVDRMLAEKAILGGEGNGGVIDPRVGLVRDSFVGMALVLDAMAAREMSVSALVAELPHYAIHKAKVSLPPEKIAASFTALQKHFADAASDCLDGLRLDWPDKWLLIRGSNTEPIVRIFAEAPAAEEANRLCDEAEGVVQS